MKTKTIRMITIAIIIMLIAAIIIPNFYNKVEGKIYHKHTDECYEIIRHSHEDSCYENIYHTHTEDCYETTIETEICEGVIKVKKIGGPEKEAEPDGRIKFTQNIEINCSKCNFNENRKIEVYVNSVDWENGTWEDILNSKLSNKIHEIINNKCQQQVEKEVTTLKCGKTEETIEETNLICGKTEGQIISKTLICPQEERWGYIVEELLEEVDGKYTVFDRRQEVSPKKYVTEYSRLYKEGYTIKEPQQKVTLSDEDDTVIQFKHERIKYRLTINTQEKINSIRLEGKSNQIALNAPVSNPVTGEFKHGDQIKIIHEAKPGYTVKHWIDEGTGQTILPTATYEMPMREVHLTTITELIKYNIQIIFNNDKNETQTEEYNVESRPLTLPDPGEKKGYTFEGWVLQGGENSPQKNVTIPTGSTGNRTYVAKWTPRNDIPYTVEHYKQSVNLREYVLEEQQPLNGTMNTNATAIAKEYTGFNVIQHENTKTTGKVTLDPILTLRIYYDRSKYKVTLNTNGGTINSGDVTEYVYGIGKALPTNVTKQGDTFEGWYDNSALTGNKVTMIRGTETGDKVYYAKYKTWNPRTYTVQFISDGEVVSTQKIGHGSAATAPELTKEGYTLTWDKNFNSVTSDLVVNAIWTKKQKAQYLVKHYTKKLDEEGYKTEETQTLEGEPGELVSAEVRKYTGFILEEDNQNAVPSGTITANETLVLKLYYKRETYNITYVTNGGIIQGEAKTQYTYGEKVTLPTKVTKSGDRFDGWYDNNALLGRKVLTIGETETGDKRYYAKYDINNPKTYNVEFRDGGKTVDIQTLQYGQSATAPQLTKPGYTLTWDKDFTNVTRDMIVNAIWSKTNTAQYKIEHYQKRLNDDKYDLIERQTLEGVVGKQAIAEARIYQGFTQNTQNPNTIASGTIQANGNLVLRLYYDRNTYNITYELNGGTWQGKQVSTYKYGEEITLSKSVTKTGYKFLGWYENENLSGSVITAIKNTDASDKKLYARWADESKYYIMSYKYEIDEKNNHITKVSPNTKVQTFLRNIETNGTKTVIDFNGKEVQSEALVGTGCKLQVEYNGEKHIYEIAVRGDLDGNGKITITDLATLNSIYVNKQSTSEIRQKAADLDYSGKITITDLSILNQAIVNKKEL